jgi:hypothetical protein
MDDGGAVSCMMSGAGFLMRAGFGGGNGFGRGSTRFGTVYSMILGGVMTAGCGGVTDSLGKGAMAGAW